MLPSLKKLNPRRPLQRVDPDDTERATKDYCRKLAVNGSRSVVALYANPRLPQRLLAAGVMQLNALPREMRAIIANFNPFDFFLSPSTTTADLTDVLERYKPKVLFWSGHTLEGIMVFESSTGRTAPTEMLNARAFQKVLEDAPSLEMVCLMGCYSNVVVPALDTPLRSRISFLAWEGVTEDSAALEFTRGAIAELAKQLSAGELNPKGVFEAAKESFVKGGFSFGNPRDHPDLPLQLRPHGVAVFSASNAPDEIVSK